VCAYLTQACITSDLTRL